MLTKYLYIMTNIELNFQKVFKMANINGQEYLNYWLKDVEILQIIPMPKYNWFYIIVQFNDNSTYSYAISQKYDCKTTGFGSVKYLKKHLKEQNIYI